MERFVRFIEELHRAVHIDDLSEIFLKYLQRYRLNKMAFLLSGADKQNLQSHIGRVYHFPNDWVKMNAVNDQSRISSQDAITFESPMHFTWQQISEILDFAHEPWTCLNHGIEEDVYNGIIIPLYSPHGRNAVVCVAGAKENAILAKDVKFIIQLSYQYYQTFLTLPVRSPQKNITQRETEILTWASRGKSNPVIAELLHISPDTVKYHWKNIFSKLQVCSRHAAISKATLQCLIKP